MPTYEYRCVAGHQYEKRESFSAKARQKCQVCGKQADRMIFAPPIVFKGSGFYVTDSRNGASSKSESTLDSASSDASASSASDHGHSHDAGGHSHPHTAPSVATDTGASESAAAS